MTAGHPLILWSFYNEMMQNNSSAQEKKPFFQRYKIHIAATGFAILIWFLVVSNEFYDAEIQMIVVQMKDELEKAKEQVLNVL